MESRTRGIYVGFDMCYIDFSLSLYSIINACMYGSRQDLPRRCHLLAVSIVVAIKRACDLHSLNTICTTRVHCIFNILQNASKCQILEMARHHHVSLAVLLRFVAGKQRHNRDLKTTSSKF